MLTADSAQASGVKWAAAAAPVRQTIPVRLRVPRSSTLGGNAAFSVTALTAWDMAAWEFADAVEGRIYGHCRMPSSLAASPNCVFTAVYAALVAGNVTLLHKYARVPAGGSLNPATFPTAIWGPGVLSGIAASYVTKELVSGPFTVAAGEMILIEITRYGADGGDTLAGTLFLLDAYVEVNI